MQNTNSLRHSYIFPRCLIVTIILVLLGACGGGSGGSYNGSSGSSGGSGSVNFSVWITDQDSDVIELLPAAISSASCSPASCIDFTGGGLSTTTSLTVDVNGNVWVVNGVATSPSLSITEITAAAVASGGCSSTTCLNYTWAQFGDVTDITVDNNGNVWLTVDCEASMGSNGASCNPPEFSQYFGVQSQNGGVVEIRPGAAQDCSSGCFFFTIPMDSNTGYPLIRPQGITVDFMGNIWFTSDGCISASNCSSDSFMGSVVEIPQTAVQAGTCAGSCKIYANSNDTTGNIMSPEGIAADSAGNVWVVNSCGPGNCIENVSGSVTEIKIGATSNCLTGCVDYTGGGLNQPVAIMFDSVENVWVENTGVMNMTEITSSAITAGECNASSCNNINVNNQPSQLHSIAIDPNGDIWTAGGSVEEIRQDAPQNCTSDCLTIGYAQAENIAIKQ